MIITPGTLSHVFVSTHTDGTKQEFLRAGSTVLVLSRLEDQRWSLIVGPRGRVMWIMTIELSLLGANDAAITADGTVLRLGSRERS